MTKRSKYLKRYIDMLDLRIEYTNAIDREMDEAEASGVVELDKMDQITARKLLRSDTAQLCLSVIWKESDLVSTADCEIAQTRKLFDGDLSAHKIALYLVKEAEGGDVNKVAAWTNKVNRIVRTAETYGFLVRDDIAPNRKPTQPTEKLDKIFTTRLDI